MFTLVSVGLGRIVACARCLDVHRCRGEFNFGHSLRNTTLCPGRRFPISQGRKGGNTTGRKRGLVPLVGIFGDRVLVPLTSCYPVAVTVLGVWPRARVGCLSHGGHPFSPGVKNGVYYRGGEYKALIEKTHRSVFNPREFFSIGPIPCGGLSPLGFPTMGVIFSPGGPKFVRGKNPLVFPGTLGGSLHLCGSEDPEGAHHGISI